MATTWENTIKGYFTHGDVECMKSQDIDLGDYATVKQHGALICEKVESGAMPPGRKWSDEWIDTFKAWVDAGCPRH